MSKLKQLRDDYNITQGQLADVLGMTQQQISRWESASHIPTCKAIKRINSITEEFGYRFTRFDFGYKVQNL